MYCGPVVLGLCGTVAVLHSVSFERSECKECETVAYFDTEVAELIRFGWLRRQECFTVPGFESALIVCLGFSRVGVRTKL